MFFLIYYTYCMPLGTARCGRPYAVAVIPFRNDRKVGLLDEFYDTCSTFHYREIMAVSRAFGVHQSTVEKWKYKLTFPRWDIAVDVIEWAKQGRPIRMVSQSQTLVNMF